MLTENTMPIYRNYKLLQRVANYTQMFNDVIHVQR